MNEIGCLPSGFQKPTRRLAMKKAFDSSKEYIKLTVNENEMKELKLQTFMN